VSHGEEWGALAPTVVAAARALAIDAVAAEFSERLERDGIEAIVLKGGALAEWLYEDAVRGYGDVDLLVDMRCVLAVESRLRELGFETGPGKAPPETPHARAWRRPSDGAVVDVHWTVSGSCVSPAETYQVLRAHTGSVRLGGGHVTTLDRTSAALLVVLHASQHEAGKPLEDLERALDRTSLGEWFEARTIADRLQADYAFSHGLRLSPRGQVLAAELGLPPAAVIDAAGSAEGSLVLGIERLRRTHGVRARLALITSEVVPNPEFMRWRLPLARRGTRGLAAAYAWRLLVLCWRGIPSVFAWWRARRKP